MRCVRCRRSCRPRTGRRRSRSLLRPRWGELIALEPRDGVLDRRLALGGVEPFPLGRGEDEVHDRTLLGRELFLDQVDRLLGVRPRNLELVLEAAADGADEKTRRTTIPSQLATTLHGCVAHARDQRASDPVDSRSCAASLSVEGLSSGPKPSAFKFSSAIRPAPFSSGSLLKTGTCQNSSLDVPIPGQPGTRSGSHTCRSRGNHAASTIASCPGPRLGPVASRLPEFLRRRRVVVGLQLGVVAVLLAFFGYALRDVWADALPRLADTDPVFLAAALGVLAAYYLLFAVGWWWLLAALRIQVSYGIALQAEMASMLAKYIPGGIWTPLARIVWLRRAGGVSDTSFVISLDPARGWALGAGRHPRLHRRACGRRRGRGPARPAACPGDRDPAPSEVFTAIARFVFRRFGARAAAAPLQDPGRAPGLLLDHMARRWHRALPPAPLARRRPGRRDDSYLGGAAAIGAIVAVLTVFAPSGLGVREASMYGLLVVVVPADVALGSTVLNRLAITLVEAALLACGILVTRLRRSPAAADGEVDERAKNGKQIVTIAHRIFPPIEMSELRATLIRVATISTRAPAEGRVEPVDHP